MDSLSAPTRLPFVPQHDAAEYLEILPAARRKAENLHAVAERVHAAAGKMKTRICLEAAEEWDCCFNTVYAPVKRFLRSLDWRDLIDRRAAGSRFWIRREACNHPADFLEFWKGLCEENQRATYPAYEKLMDRLRRWRSGDPAAAIPGFVVPPHNAPGCRHPRKWSYRDLLREAPAAAESIAARNGRTQAMALMPGILTTRKGGWPCMEYQFDDMWHDFEVIHGAKICRLLEFNAVDFYTGFLFNPGLKPRVKNDAGRHEALSEKDFRLWAVNFLATTGWSPRGTTLQGERGTAAFRALAPKLEHWSGGLLKIPLPGMSGAPAFPGGWAERAKGNPNAKALKEGLGKLIHGRLADLPGQVGMNPEDKPASSFGRDREAADLIALQRHLSTPLHHTHLSFEQAAFIVVRRYMELNRRTDHAMEGWIEEGHFTQEYCLCAEKDQWLDLRELDEEARQAILIIASANPNCLRPRRLSPYEVIAPALPQNIRLCPEAEADCLFEDARRTLAVTAGHLAFADQDFGPGTFRYIAEYQDRSGFRRTLPNGSEVQLVVNPFNPERGFLYTPRNQYLGIVRRDHAVTRSDRDAIHRRIGEKERHYKDVMLAASVRHGLKRENQLTDNARNILDALRHPDGPSPAPSPDYDLSEEYAAADPRPDAASAEPADYTALL